MHGAARAAQLQHHQKYMRYKDQAASSISTRKVQGTHTVWAAKNCRRLETAHLYIGSEDAFSH